MKKILLLAALLAMTLSMSAQKGETSAIVGLGYQTDYKRFAIGAQGRYHILDNVRIAPDITFYFPKDKVTGVDVMINAHYVFRFPQDKFSVYPLAGIGIQNNFYGKQNIVIGGIEQKTDSHSKTDLAFNLGGGISYLIGAKTFLNAEVKFILGDNDCAVVMIGYGYKF
ncbi:MULTISPECIES: outer membrane protein [unclassified Dysgonomonas]|uniref:outer membrane protein n=1 Tax=unclassified Dysgonomonas TaxID=2630389 RepID=UPI0013EB7D02|nr:MULTISPECIES: outer membrane beta-barrel protein [unclassified Dysgonomonas]